jgi:proline iminopeptidase
VEPGIELAHFSDGSGTPVLVVHGGPGMPFTGSVDGLHKLSDRYRFEYYAQRGCGASTRPIERFSSSNMVENMQLLENKLGLGTQIADIERIRQILGQEKLILVGHSFGGFLAALYAAEFPEHVQALVLIAPAEMLVMPQKNGGLYESVRPFLPETMRPAYDEYLKRYFDFGKLFTLSDAEIVALNQEFVPYYMAAMQAKGFKVPEENNPPAGVEGGWMVWGMYMSMGQQHDYRAALRQITAPTLVLHGKLDLQSEAASREYVDLIPKAQFMVLDQSSHFPFTEQPEVFADQVGKFLDGVKP